MEAIAMKKGDEFVHFQAGAGGFGDPLEREPSKVLGDMLNELISPEYAEEVYGVIVQDELVCEEKTSIKRKQLKAKGSHKNAYLKHFHKTIGIKFSAWKPHFPNIRIK